MRGVEFNERGGGRNYEGGVEINEVGCSRN